MKRMTNLIAAAVVIALTLSFGIGMAYAKDKILDVKIEEAVTKLDKYGKEYVRFIVTENRELHGVKYDTTVAVMAFGETVELAKKYNQGEQLKAVCSSKEYNGRLSYTVITFLK